MKRIVVLGSTGSIGRNALEIVRGCPSRFAVEGLGVNSDIETLYRQIKVFRPHFVCIGDAQAGRELSSRLGKKGPKVFLGEEGLIGALESKGFDMLVMAISGSAALLPLLKAIAMGKDIALANKEALVMAGPMIMAEARQNNVRIIPIDSEESAIWQCLEAEDKTKIRTIYLTASGGPFREFSSKDLRGVSKKQVLRHPRWKMGEKITVDSATLMNKGFEMLEATHLFGVTPQAIRVVIHPEAIIHSMVEFIDGVIMAQLSVTDMRIPIQYALAYPERIPTSLRGLDFCKLKSLNFQEPDFRRFPCLGFAYQAAREAGTMPCVLNSANEVGVESFLNGGLDFTGIPRVIETVMAKHQSVKKPGLDDILAAQAWAKTEAFKVIKKRGKA